MQAFRTVFAGVVFCSLFSIPLLGASVSAAEFPVATTAKHQQTSLSGAFDATNKRVLAGFLDSVNCPGKKCVETTAAQLVSAETGALVGTPISVSPGGGYSRRSL